MRCPGFSGLHLTLFTSPHVCRGYVSYYLALFICGMGGKGVSPPPHENKPAAGGKFFEFFLFIDFYLGSRGAGGGGIPHEILPPSPHG